MTDMSFSLSQYSLSDRRLINLIHRISDTVNRTEGTQENEQFKKFHENSMFYTIAELVIGSRGISMTFPEMPEIPMTDILRGSFGPILVRLIAKSRLRQ
jgi:hypothetical protein